MILEILGQILIFGVTLATGVIAVGRYTGKLELHLKNIGTSIKDVKLTVDDISKRVGKVEDKIIILTERVGALESLQNGNSLIKN